MKYYAAPILALASVASAYPHPAAGADSTKSTSLLSRFIPSLGGGSGLPGLGGGLLGGGSSLPSMGGGLPGLGGGSGLPGLGGGSGLPGLGGGSGLPGLGGGSGLPGLGGSSKSRSLAGSGRSMWSSWLPGGFGQGTNTADSTSTGGDTSGSGNIGSNCQPQTASGFMSVSENGILNKNCCTDLTVVFARGTGELGNVGTVTGPPMFSALRSMLGNSRVTVQGVDYPASYAGTSTNGGTGGQTMASLVRQAKSQCPNTKVIVSGYSQGAMVVHSAFKSGLSSSLVAGAVLFGDPLRTSPISGLSSNVIKEFCGTSDNICGYSGDGGATGGHLNYASSAKAAATFAIQVAGLS